jgi:hypothetical protein
LFPLQLYKPACTVEQTTFGECWETLLTDVADAYLQACELLGFLKELTLEEARRLSQRFFEVTTPPEFLICGLPQRLDFRGERRAPTLTLDLRSNELLHARVDRIDAAVQVAPHSGGSGSGGSFGVGEPSLPLLLKLLQAGLQMGFDSACWVGRC